MIATLLTRRAIIKGFEVFNTRDHVAAHKDWADDMILYYPGDIEGVSGKHVGTAAIESWYQRLFEQVPLFQVKIKAVAVHNLFDFVGNNVVAVMWDLDKTNVDGFRMENTGVSVATIKQRKAVSYQIFLADTGENLRRAWGVID
jgi:hypothetical protein